MYVVFLGKAKDTTYTNSYIDIIGDETTPTNVVIKPASGTIIRASDTKFRLRGLSIEGSSSSSTQGGIVAFRSVVWVKNTRFYQVGTIQMNDGSNFSLESGSTAGTTWTGAGAGTLFSLIGNSRATISSAATLQGGSGTTSIFGLSSYSRATIVSTTGTLRLIGGAATHTGLSVFQSAFSCSANLIIEDVTATTTTYANAAVKSVENSIFFMGSNTTLTIDNAINALYMAKFSSIQSGTSGITATYTNISGKWLVTDKTSSLDAPDYFDPPGSVEINWGAVRTAGVEMFDPVIYTAPGVASDATMSPPSSGNYFNITGTTTINNISTLNLYSKVIFLNFQDNVTVTNQAPPVGTSWGIKLTGADDFSATSGDQLVLIKDDNDGWW